MSGEGSGKIVGFVLQITPSVIRKHTLITPHTTCGANQVCYSEHSVGGSGGLFDWIGGGG